MEIGLDRETLMSVGVVGLSIVGAVGHYFYHKGLGNGLKTYTGMSLVRSAFLGFVAGLILLALAENIGTMSHKAMIIPALVFGGMAESVVGKYLGWKETRPKKVKPVEVEAPKEEKKEEMKPEEKKKDTA